MRRWTESNSLIFESDDGFKISINPENYTHVLWTPTGYLIGFWRFSYIHEHITDPCEYRCYLLYICERQINIVGDRLTHAARTALDKMVCTRDYSSGKYYDLDRLPDPHCTVDLKENYNKCGNCHHLIFKDHKHNEGLCNLTRLHRCFSDLCVHDEDIM